MNNMFLDFWKKAIVKYWDFYINPNETLENQLDKLKEDLVQIEFFKSNLLIDIGFYPSFSKNWKLVLILIKNGDWDNFLEKFENSNIIELQESINYIIKKYKL